MNPTVIEQISSHNCHDHMELEEKEKKTRKMRNFTIETTNLKRHSSSSLEEESSLDIQTDSKMVSVHKQLPFLTIPLPNFAIVLPVATEIIDRNSLSHPFGTYNQSLPHKNMNDAEIKKTHQGKTTRIHRKITEMQMGLFYST